MPKLAPYIQELSKELEIDPPLSSNDEGAYEFLVNPETKVVISPWNSGCMFFSTVGPCPEVNADQFLTRVMLANMFGQGTGGALLGMAEDGVQIVLALEVEEIGNFRDFHDRLEDFLNTQDFWVSEIAEATPEPKEKAVKDVSVGK